MLDSATQMRLTGLSTGLDTDAIIQNLGRVHTLRIDNVKRDRTYLQWQQEGLRNTVRMINDFVRSNLNITNPASNFRSATAFAKFNYNIAMGALKTDDAKNAAANIVSINANADLRNFNQTIQQVSQLATRDTWSGSEAGLREINTSGFDLNRFVGVNSETGLISSVSSASFVLSIDNVSRTVTLDQQTMWRVYDEGSVKDVSTASMAGNWDTSNVFNHHVLHEGKSMTVAEFVIRREKPHYTDGDVDAALENPAEIQSVVDTLNATGNESYFTSGGYNVENVVRVGTKQERSEAFANALNAEIARQFGNDFNNIVSVRADGELTFTLEGSTLTISESLGGAATMRNFGLEGGATTGVVGSRKLNELMPDMFGVMVNGQPGRDEEGNLLSRQQDIFINGVRITLDGSDTLTTMMTKINASEAGVTLSYNSANDRFELASKQEGTAANIGEVTGNTALFFDALKIGKAVQVEREFTNGTDTIWAPGYKLMIGGQFTHDLQPGERVVGEWTNGGEGPAEVPGATNTVKSQRNVVEILSNGDISIREQTGTTHIFPPVPGFDAMNPEFKWVDEGGNDHTFDSFDELRDFVIGKGYDDVQRTHDDGFIVIKTETATTPTIITNNGDGTYGAGNQSMKEVFADAGVQLGGTDGVGTRQEGQNLRAVINGAEFIRQTNSFTHEGMTYTFHNLMNEDVEDWRDIPAANTIRIDVAQNTDEIIEGIKGFVDEYNKIMSHLNSLLSERKTKEDRQYKPLTDDEKKAMSEDEIKAYEDRAKIGLLANDADLRKLQNELRQAIYMKVDGVGLTMSDIGITTSPNWQDGGLLVIDEDKLRAGIEGNYESVVQLFTQNSNIPASDIANRGQRYNQTGIAQRINDIMNDAVRTTRDDNNRKGSLIEKAGIENDVSVVQNSMSERLQQFDKRISTLLDRWMRQENSLYAMFARMETAMMQMQSQQSNLAQLMAQNGM